MVSSIISEFAALDGQWPTILNIVLYVTVFILVMTVFLFSYVMVLRVLNTARGNYRRRFKKKWRRIIFDWMSGNCIEPFELSHGNQLLLMETWLAMRRLIEDDSAKELDDFAIAFRLDETAGDILQYRSYGAEDKAIWLQQIAIRAARCLRTEAAMAALIRASEANNYRVNIEATCALVELEHEAAELSVLSSLMQFQQWTPLIVMKVSAAGGSNILHLVGEQLDSMNPEQARNLISLMGASTDRTLLPLLIDVLQNTDDMQEIASILRTLGRLGDHSHVKFILPFLQHPDPVLRLRAVVALGQLGDEHDLRDILPLTTDNWWWIRYRAAESYLAIAKPPPKMFNRFVTSLKNERAREMFQHVYVEKQYA